MHLPRFTAIFALASLPALLMGTALTGQAQPPNKRRHDLSVRCPATDNHSSTTKAVCDEVIRIPGAPWLRLFFGSTHLPPGSRLLITGLRDGWTQQLDATSLADYHHASCFFRGEAIRVRLEAGAHTRQNRLTIVAADAGLPVTGSTESICDSVDDRVRSYDQRQGRLSGGCSGFLINCDIMLTAGHCFRNSKSLILHFNTGLSGASGHPADAHPDDQYPTIPTTVSSLDSGVGADWGICRLAKNSNTGLYPGQAQGAWYRVGAVPTTSTGQQIDVTGYGTTSPPGVLSQVQKKHVGAVHSILATTIRHRADTSSGSSGSPMVATSHGGVVGIHTHSGCDAASTSSNAGTRIDRADLTAAIAATKASSCPTCDPNQHSYFIPDSRSTSGSCNLIPFGSSASSATWSHQKYQTLLTRDDLCSSSGHISDLAFIPCSSGVRRFKTILIRMAQTHSTGIGTDFRANMSRNVKAVLDTRDFTWYQTANAWNRIGLDRSYHFDSTMGGPNVVVEITVTGADFEGSGPPGMRIGDRKRVFATNWVGNPPAHGNHQIGALKTEVLLDAHDMHRFGNACAGSSSQFPELSFTGSARIGGKGCAVHLRRAPPNATAFLSIGLPRFPNPLGLALLGAPGCSLYHPNIMVIVRQCDSTGRASLPMTVPSGVPVGARLWLQWLPVDKAANTLGLTVSNAGRVLTGY